MYFPPSKKPSKKGALIYPAFSVLNEEDERTFHALATCCDMMGHNFFWFPKMRCSMEIPVYSQYFDVNLLHLLQCRFFQKSADCGWWYSHAACFFQYVAYLTSLKILLSVTFNCLCVSRDFLSCFWTVFFICFFCRGTWSDSRQISRIFGIDIEILAHLRKLKIDIKSR